MTNIYKLMREFKPPLNNYLFQLFTGCFFQFKSQKRKQKNATVIRTQLENTLLLFSNYNT